MNDTTKSILTHTAVGLGGFYFGRKGSTPVERSKNIFSRFIPTLIIAYGVAHFAINTPGEFFDYKKQSDNNETRVKEKALDKGINIYDNKTREFDDLQKQFDIYKNNSEKEKQTLLDISKEQNQKLNNIESKLNNIKYDAPRQNVKSEINTNSSAVTNNRSSRISSTENNAYTTWLALDKTDQRFYFYKNGELEKSGPMIFNGEGKPANGIYDVKKIAPKTGALFPGFATLDGVVGISGAGQNNEYAPAICNSSNVTNNGFRISNADMDYLMSSMHLGTKVEVRQ